MKTKWLLIFFVFMFAGMKHYTANAAVGDSIVATEWIAVKESSIDSLTLTYLQQKGLISYITPKEENNNVFFNIVSYLSQLLDKSLSSISSNANKFYYTPVGFWVTWGIFYHYTGGEILHYLLTFLYLIVITIFFIWLWRKHCIHKVIPIELEDAGTTTDGEIEVKLTDTVHYEIKHASVSMQFWLLLIYLILFIIGAGVL